MAIAGVLLLLACPACTELAQIIAEQVGTPFELGSSGVPTGGGSGDSGSGGGGSSDGEGVVPVVSLRASNTSPAVNEELILTCSLVRGDRDGLRFDFQPNSGRLVVNRTTGTGRMVLTEADIGAALSFTCSASNAFGTGEPSRPVLVIPIAQP